MCGRGEGDVCVSGGGGGGLEKRQDIMYSLYFNGHANKITEIGKLKLTETGRRTAKKSWTEKC